LTLFENFVKDILYTQNQESSWIEGGGVGIFTVWKSKLLL